MNRKIPLNFPLFELSYGSDLPIEQYFIILFDLLPSKRVSKGSYSDNLISYFKENGFVEESKISYFRKCKTESFQILLLNHEKQMMINIKSNIIGNHNNLVSFEVYYNLKNGNLSTQLKFSEIDKYEKKSKDLGGTNIHLVTSDAGHLYTEEYNLIVPEVDIELNYGKDFVLIHNNILKRLNTNYDNGIILLHVDPGTGKTTYLKYLTKYIQEKNVLFIPSSLREVLCEPSIIPSLMENKNSILLIEDAEKVIADREGRGSSAGVSNLLNLTDGILGDCLNIQVIATFNMNREKIDRALLRKGRLIAEHKFEKLNIENTNKLLKHIGKNYVVNEPMSLADIYNIDSSISRVTKEERKLGF